MYVCYRSHTKETHRDVIKNTVGDVNCLGCTTDNHFISLEINFLLCKKKGIELGPCDLMVSLTLIGTCFKQWIVTLGYFIPSIVLVLWKRCGGR